MFKRFWTIFSLGAPYIFNFFAAIAVVCYTAVFRGGALRDDTKDGYVANYQYDVKLPA